jgi:hypothetical protein
MPSKPRAGVRPLYVELPQALYEALERGAARNRRPVKAELVRAVERHVATPELVVSPPLPDGADEKKPRGRPKKKTTEKP